MKKHTTLFTVIGLFVMSAVLYAIQLGIFSDPNSTLFYMLQDWAFLPVQIALVTIVVGTIINEKEKSERLSKTIIIASAFFHDFGCQLLHEVIHTLDRESEIPDLNIDESWEEKDFCRALKEIRDWNPVMSVNSINLMKLKHVLQERRLSILVISSNPVLLDHEDFSDMLMNIFHMSDELNARDDFENMSDAERTHLNTDMGRLFIALSINWMCHMQHMQSEYPALYLLEARNSPFKND